MPPHDITIALLDPADETHVSQAARLIEDAFPDWFPSVAEYEAEVAEALAPDRICLAATHGADLLGWVGAIPEYSHAWELHPLVVQPDAHRLGIGRALVTALETRVLAKGALTLYLGTDDDGPTPRTTAGGIDLFPDPLAHAARFRPISHPAGFYARLGFVVIGLLPDANGPGKPDVFMAKRLGVSPAYPSDSASVPAPTATRNCGADGM